MSCVLHSRHGEVIAVRHNRTAAACFLIAWYIFGKVVRRNTAHFFHEAAADTWKKQIEDIGSYDIWMEDENFLCQHYFSILILFHK